MNEMEARLQSVKELETLSKTVAGAGNGVGRAFFIVVTFLHVLLTRHRLPLFQTISSRMFVPGTILEGRGNFFLWN